jgi:hypothetical protein
MARSGSFGLNIKKTWTSTTPIPEHKLGDLGTDIHGEYVYVTASAAISQYDFVLISSTFTAAPLTTTNASTTAQYVGVAQIAFANGESGWVWIGGPAGGGVGTGIKGNVSAAVTIASIVYTTATAGQVSNTSASTVKIQNVSPTAATAAAGSVELRSFGYLSVNA